MLKFLKYFVLVIIILIAVMLFFIILDKKEENIKLKFNIKNNSNLTVMKPEDFSFRTYYLKNYNFNKNKIKDLYIKSEMFDVIFKDSQNDKINIKLKIDLGSSNPDLLNDFKQKVVKKVEKRFNKINIEVKIPDEIKNDLKFKNKIGISGNIIIELPLNFKFKNMNINNVSGKIEMEKNVLNGEKFVINSVSGDVNLQKLNLGKIELNSVSGDITISDINSKNIKVNCVSGDTEISSLKSNDIGVNSISGDMRIDSIKKINKIEASTISGDIFINLATFENNGFKKFVFHSISGNINCFFPLKLKKHLRVSVKTTSGFIKTNDYKIIKGKRISFNPQIKAIAELDVKTTSGNVTISFR